MNNDQAIEQLKLVYASTSWKITRPLRQIKLTFQWLKHLVLQTPQNIPFIQEQQQEQKPLLKINAFDGTSNLSPRAQHIYNQLKQSI